MPTNNHSDNLFDAQAPMDDEKHWDLLSIYVDGEADPAQAAIVEQMLSSDPAYRRDFDFLMQTSKTMQRMEELAPPLGLRDAIYAGTVNRPTLAGRLRAVWSRATTPTFTRYASVGGAFAVAVLGAVIVWPHLSSHPSPGTANTPVAITDLPQTALATDTTSPRMKDNRLPLFVHSQDPMAKPHPHMKLVDDKPLFKQNLVPVLHKGGDKNAAYRGIVRAPLPRNYYPPKVNLTHNEGPQTVATGYPYDKKMDEKSGQERSGTLGNSTGNDFGPMLFVAETPVSPAASTENQTASSGNAGEGVRDPQPKQTVHVATLPPGASQNIAAAVIRHNITAKYSGYERSVAENIQRHEVTIDVIKGSF